jgi:MFS transporter, DHA2 family, multidrug resistance protein
LSDSEVSGAGAPAGAPMPTGRAGAGKWLIAIVVMFGTFLAVMDVSVVNVAMPYMMGTFGVTLSAITWVATSYSIAEIILATMAGWLTTLMGRKRLYVTSFAVFTIGSMLAGTARTFWAMLLFRTIQGIGGGSLIPISQAILRESFPPDEQGLAMSIYGMGVVLAPGAGVILGGWLTDHYGWPWIFFINVPVAIVGILMVTTFLADPHYLRRGVRRVDWFGILFLGITITGMQIVLERGQEANWFDSPWIVAGTVVTVAALVVLIVWEFRVHEPVVDLRLLRNVPLSVGSGMGLIFGITLFGTTFLLPALLQQLMGYPALQTGIVLLPRAAALLVMMPVAGWLYNRVDPRVLIAGGGLLIYLSYQQLARLSTDVATANLLPILMLMGLGMPFMFVTLSTVALSTVPRHDMTSASGLYTLTRRIGGNLGYAFLATVVANRSQFHHARLVSAMDPYSGAYAAFHAAVTSRLSQAGMPSPSVAATAIASRLLNQQSAMLAYNDASWLLGVLFLVAFPLIFLLPSHRRIRAEAHAAAGLTVAPADD